MINKKTVFNLLYWLVIFPIVTVLLLEATLQLGTLVNSSFLARENVGQWLTNNYRILTLGDSNTYGIYLAAEDSYPAQLEQQWNNRLAKGQAKNNIEIINLGYPGTDSSRILTNLDQGIKTFRPDAVLMMIGANDFLTEPIPGNAVLIANPAWQWIEKHSRLYKLVGIAWRSQFDESALKVPERTDTLDSTTSSQDFKKLHQAAAKGFSAGNKRQVDYGATTFDFTTPAKTATATRGNPKKNLEKNLVAIIDYARANDIRVVFLTYPAEQKFYRKANMALRDVIKTTGYPFFIDVAADMQTRCGDGKCGPVFFADHHATAAGNMLVAEIVANQLATLAGEAK